MLSLFKNFLLFIASLFVAILCIEIFLKSFYPSTSYLYTPKKAYNLSAPIKRYKPGATFEIIRPEFRMQVQINSKGIRDREHDYEPKEDVYRILGLGDSFTFGTGVPFEDIYLSVLERKLQDEWGPRIEVVNGGHSGYGTNDALIFFKTEGKKYKPNLVILGFYVGNDYFDNLSRGSIFIKKVSETKAPSLWIYHLKVFLNNNSELYPFLIKRIKSNYLLVKFLQRCGLVAPNILHFIPFSQKKGSPIFDEAKRLAKNYLEDINKEVSAIGAKLVVIIIPDQEMVYQKYWQMAIRQYGLNSLEYETYKLIQETVNICKELGISSLNHYPALKSYGKDNVDLYFPKNRHFNSLGHKVTADEILKFLKTNVVLKR